MEDPNVEKARQIIAANRYLSLATCRGDKVWAAALAYVVDEDYNFYFYSAIDSIHIEHIGHNPQVAFTIFDSTWFPNEADGLQVAGIAGQVEKAELPRVVDLYWNQMFPDPEVRAKWMRPYEDFLKNKYPVQRFFQIFPTEVYKLDTSILEVDRRIQIGLKELRRQPAKYPTLAQVSGS